MIYNFRIHAVLLYYLLMVINLNTKADVSGEENVIKFMFTLNRQYLKQKFVLFITTNPFKNHNTSNYNAFLSTKVRNFIVNKFQHTHDVSSLFQQILKAYSEYFEVYFSTLTVKIKIRSPRT